MCVCVFSVCECAFIVYLVCVCVFVSLCVCVGVCVGRGCTRFVCPVYLVLCRCLQLLLLSSVGLLVFCSDSSQHEVYSRAPIADAQPQQMLH